MRQPKTSNKEKKTIKKKKRNRNRARFLHSRVPKTGFKPVWPTFEWGACELATNESRAKTAANWAADRWLLRRMDGRTAAAAFGADLEDVNVKTHLHKYLLYLRLFLSGIGHEASGICVLKATVRTRSKLKNLSIAIWSEQLCKSRSIIKNTAPSLSNFNQR